MLVQVCGNRTLQIGLEFENDKKGGKVCVGFREKTKSDGPFELDDSEAKRLLAKKNPPVEKVVSGKKAKKK